MKKLLWKILAVLVGLLVVLFLARNVIARLSVEYGAKKITGFPLTIGSIDLGLFSSKVDVHDLKLMNPSEFSEKTFVDMPQLYIDYRLGSMMSTRSCVAKAAMAAKISVLTSQVACST